MDTRSLDNGSHDGLLGQPFFRKARHRERAVFCVRASMHETDRREAGIGRHVSSMPVPSEILLSFRDSTGIHLPKRALKQVVADSLCQRPRPESREEHLGSHLEEDASCFHSSARGIMEKKMETTTMGYIGIIGYILGLYGDNGKENGNYYIIIGYILGFLHSATTLRLRSVRSREG